MGGYGGKERIGERLWMDYQIGIEEECWRRECELGLEQLKNTILFLHFA